MNPIQHRLTTLHRRMRRLVMLYGLGWAVAAGLGAALALGWLDYLLRFHDRGLRVMASLGLASAWIWACYRYGYVAWRHRRNDVHLALRVQRRFPQLGDRLASAVEFLHQRENDATAGAPSLRRALIAETAASIESLDFNEVLDPRPSYRALLAMMGVGLAVAVLAIVHPVVAKVAAVRLLNPLDDTAWPRTTWLALRTPVTQVGRAQAFEVEVVDTHGTPLPPLVRIHYRYEHPDGTTVVESEVMRPLGDARVIRRENIVRPFAYRIEGGDDQTMAWIPVAVIELPAIASLSIRVIPPAYTGWKPYEAPRQVRALVGTRLEFVGHATKPLDSATLCFDDGRRIPAQLKDGTEFRLATSGGQPLVVEKSLSYWFALGDREGLGVAVADRGEIRAAVDSPPSVSMEQPVANLFVTPRAVVPLRVAVKDDWAIRHVDLLIARSDRPQAEPVRVGIYRGPDRPAPPVDTRNLDGMPVGEGRTINHVWDLESLELRPGIELTVHAEAADYRPATGRSEPRRIHVITPEELQDRLGARQSLILAELDRTLKMQQESRNQVAALAIQASQTGRLKLLDIDHLQAAALGQRQVDRTLTSRTEGVPLHVLALLADLDDNRVEGSDLRRHMESILTEIGRLEKEHLPRVSQELTAAIKASQIALQEPLDTRESRAASALTLAVTHQERVIEALQRLLAQLGQWDSYRRFHRDVARLLRDQEEVAQRTSALGRQTLTRELKDLLPQQQADLRILARQQLESALRLDQLAEEMRQGGEQLRSSDPLVAETLGEAVVEIQRRVIGGHMRTVQENIESNRMGQAVQGQKQIVDDLRDVVNLLAGRREHELAQIAKKLDELQKDLESLARREAELRDRLRQATGSADPARRPTLAQLRADQTQIESDTRAVAQWLQRLSVERAGQGTSHAADLMARGAQACAQGDGPAAIQRAEEAQAQLAEAVAQLQGQRRQVEAEWAAEQRRQLDREIRKWVKQQEKLREETRNLDDAMQSQGRLSSSQGVALADLARRQRMLQTQTQSLGNRQGESDAFGLAISGAGNDMGLAADQLDRRQPGSPAQQAQHDALRRLALALEASASKPLANTSTNPRGDQAGQGGAQDDGQALPQLRLIKSLQEEINRRTRQLEQAGAAQDDDSRRRYTGLSDEQGRLADVTQKVAPAVDQGSGIQKPAPRPKSSSPSSDRKPDDLPPDLMNELGSAATPEDQQPLAAVVRHMRQVQQRVGLADSGPQTQETQRQIVVGLEQLIAQASARSHETTAEKRPALSPSQAPGGQPKPSPSGPSQPSATPGVAKSSSEGGGTQKPIDPRQVHEIQRRFWGELPEKSRELLFQSAVEEFLPSYEARIEQYYRRLADEKGKP